MPRKKRAANFGSSPSFFSSKAVLSAITAPVSRLRTLAETGLRSSQEISPITSPGPSWPTLSLPAGLANT